MSFYLTKASIYYIHYLQAVNYAIHTNKGYLLGSMQPDLFNSACSKIETPRRIKLATKNQLIFRKSIKKIETLYYLRCR